MDRSLETEPSAQRPARLSEALRIAGVVQHRRYRPATDKYKGNIKQSSHNNHNITYII